jgi:hypothetical protein
MLQRNLKVVYEGTLFHCMRHIRGAAASAHSIIIDSQSTPRGDHERGEKGGSGKPQIPLRDDHPVRDLLQLCFLRLLSRQDAVARALDGARAASSGEAAWRRAPAHGGRRQGRGNADAHGPLQHAYVVISGVNFSLANLTLPRVPGSDPRRGPTPFVVFGCSRSTLGSMRMKLRI